PSSYLLGALSMAAAGRRPLVMSRVSLNWYQRQLPILGWIERRILHPRASFAIANCEAIIDELRAEGIPERKLVLVRNGIDAASMASVRRSKARAREQFGIPPSSLVLSAVGNLHTYKGHADLLHALHLAAASMPSDWFLLVAGRDVGGNLAQL